MNGLVSRWDHCERGSCRNPARFIVSGYGRSWRACGQHLTFIVENFGAIRVSVRV